MVFSRVSDSTWAARSARPPAHPAPLAHAHRIVPRALRVLALLACLVPASRAGAQPPWIKASPGGGGAFNCVDVSVTGKVLVGSDLSGAYLRTGIQPWVRLGKADGLNRTFIACVRWSPATGDTALAGGRNGLFRSLNGGVSWQLTSGPPLFETEYFSALGWSKSHGNTVYVAGAASSGDSTVLLWRSLDGGGTWTFVPGDLPTSEGLRALKLVVHPSDPNTLYMITGPDASIMAAAPKRALYKSVNGGSNWTLKSGADAALDVAVHPVTPNIVLMTISTGPDNTGQLKRSTDGGDSWAPVLDNTGAVWWDGTNALLINIGLDACGSIPANAGRWESINGGVTWTRIDTGATWETGWTDCQHARGIPFAGVANALSAKGEYWVTSQFVWRFASGKYTSAFSSSVGPGLWITTGLDNSVPVSIADAEDSATLYTGYYDIGLWRTQDAGASWTMINPILPDWDGVGGNVTSVVADSARPGVLWASISESSKPPYLYRVYRSTNAGTNWGQISSGLPTPAFLYGLSMDRLSPTASRRLWVTANGALYRSDDDGANWQPASTAGGLPTGGLFVTAVDPRDSNRIFVGGWAGLWRSGDGGLNWTKLSAGFDYSTAPGEIGAENTTVHRVKWHGPQQILADPFTPGKVWVTAFVKDTTNIPALHRGLYMSTSNGDSFTEVRRVKQARGIAIDSVGRRAMFTTGPATSSGSNGSEMDESPGLEIGRSTNGTAWTWSLDAPNPDIRFPFGWTVYAGGEGQRWMAVPGYGFMRKLNVPVAENDAFVVGSNSSGNLLPVLANDHDPDIADTLVISLLNLHGTQGSASIAGSTVSYSPPPGFTGVDFFGYTIEDLTGATSSATVAVNVVVANPTTLDIPIAASSDDAEESDTGVVNISSSDLEMTMDLTPQTVGLRFGPIPVPQGTTIAAAHIQFTVDETTTEATTLTLRGQASDNAPTFTTATGNITARPLTTASALWTPPPWPTLGAAGTEQESPDLAAVINEIVNRPGWVSGQSLAIIISGTGRRVAQSWNLAPSGAPVLHVEYGGSIPVDVGNGPAPGLALERVRPTPSRGVLGVDLSLPDARPARLELIDIAGRRVATRELAGRGPGRHHVELARGLRAGVYLVRLVQGDLARTLKAVVLD